MARQRSASRRAVTDAQSIADAQDRPREKLLRTGAWTLGDNELLSLLLGHGTAGRPSLDLATALLREVGGTHGLTRASPSRLARLRGVGAAKAARVLAGVELGRRTLAVSPPAKLALRSADDLAALLVPRFGAHPTERVGVVMLDSRHRLMRVHLVSDGALDAALAVPRDVFREAAIAGAAAVAVFHNHPSGDPTPTASDIELTRRLISAGRIVGIEVVDHLILVDGAYCSLRKAEVL